MTTNFPLDADEVMGKDLSVYGGGRPKVALLEKRRLISKSDVDLQGALSLIFQALGEVDPEADGSL